MLSENINGFRSRIKYVMYDILLSCQDMTARDLLQQRTTTPEGDTVWRLSPLVEAALEGRLAVLDGLHRAHKSSLAVLQRLVHDRELQLYDGTRLMSEDKFEDLKVVEGLTDGELEAKGIRKIHSAFRQGSKNPYISQACAVLCQKKN